MTNNNQIYSTYIYLTAVNYELEVDRRYKNDSLKQHLWREEIKPYTPVLIDINRVLITQYNKFTACWVIKAPCSPAAFRVRRSAPTNGLFCPTTTSFSSIFLVTTVTSRTPSNIWSVAWKRATLTPSARFPVALRVANSFIWVELVFVPFDPLHTWS